MKKICSECVSEEGLRDLVNGENKRGKCSYCKKTRVLVIDASEVIELITECIPRHYEDPANSVSYDSQEGGYLISPSDSREILESAGLEMANEDFILEAANALDEISTDWVETDPYASRYNEQLMYDWGEFANQVKHVTRYTFFRARVDHWTSGDSAVEQPYEVMDHIGRVIRNLEAFRVIPRGTVLYRARRHPSNELVQDASAIGPAPKERAKQNRMSAAGISAFYGGFEIGTVVAEVRTPLPDEQITIGRFKTLQDLVLIDLSKIDLSGTIFVSEPVISHEDVRFLLSFRDEISKPIEPDDRIHIEYVPTQVLTEYLRYCFARGGKRIHGIIYPSSLSIDGENIILFCDEALGTDPHNTNSVAWLRIVGFAANPVNV